MLNLTEALADDPDDELVPMCHDGVTITVQRRFLERRLELGDTLGPCDCCAGRVGVVFDREVYSVAPGDGFLALVCLCPTLEMGLFSYGIEVDLVGGDLFGLGFRPSVPSELDFHSVLGPGADLEVSPLHVTAKGTVDFFREPYSPYTAPSFAYVHVPGLPSGSYRLEVRLKNDLGPTEQVFVTGDGIPLDSELTFSPSTIVVQDPQRAIAGTLPGDRLTEPYVLINPFSSAQQGLRLLVRNLPDEVTLANAAGFMDGIPYLVVSTVLAPGASATLALEYIFDNSVAAFVPEFEVRNSVGQLPPPISMDCEILRSGVIQITFESIEGSEYFIQYSHDLVSWTTVLPTIDGTGGPVQWTDDGPPTSTAFPALRVPRFYRLLRLGL
ncbi:MAG: hypothetical protein ACKV19_24915 [Verrucomicrobiales bacterium]